MNEKRRSQNVNWVFDSWWFIVLTSTFLVWVLFFSSVVALGPEGPSYVNVTANETRNASARYMINTSGGYITTLNITAVVQNPRWKAFVGWVNGRFTLNDALGSTIYDWSISTITGEVYATRNGSTISWASIKCANTTILYNENIALSHSSADDNITKTFRNRTHTEFFIGAVNISLNTCPALRTYQNNVTQDFEFEEVVLFDGADDTSGGNLVYSTIIENHTIGFDGVAYDFQMIVPENGALGFSGSTAYYLYVELS